MLQWFDSTATLLFGERDGMVDMSDLGSGDALVVWVQVPPLVIFLEHTFTNFFFDFSYI